MASRRKRPSYVDIAVGYAKDAWADVDQERHCRYVRLAAKRFLDDLKRAKQKRPPFTFSEWHVDDVCSFMEKLPHVEGSWDTKTITLEPWQVFIFANIFGFRSGPYRRFNTVYWEVARKNAKSTTASGIALYCLNCEDEQGPQVKTAATTGSQARIVFDVAKKMVEMTPDLEEAFELRTLSNSIACNMNMGSIQPINAKASTQDGLNPHLSVLDELHAHKDRKLFDVLKSARGARKNPLSLYITTAGYFLDGVCYEQRTMLVKILEGVFQADHYFGIIFTLDNEKTSPSRKDDEALDETNWVKSNPNLGASVQLKELRDYAKEARMSPGTMGEFKTKRLNIWTLAKDAWLNHELWKKCDGPVEEDALKGLTLFGGLDLAATTDISGFVLLGLNDEDQLLVRPYLYVPEAKVIEAVQKGTVPYDVWVKQGFLIETPGNVTDYDYIERDIRDVFAEYNVARLGYDPWNAYHLTNKLMEDELPLVEMRQGTKTFNAPMKEFERRVESGRISHGGHPVLSWMASNIVARYDVNENMAPDRKNSLGKIDGIVGSLMGLGLLLLGDVDGDSIYEERGVIVV